MMLCMYVPRVSRMIAALPYKYYIHVEASSRNSYSEYILDYFSRYKEKMSKGGRVGGWACCTTRVRNICLIFFLVEM